MEMSIRDLKCFPLTILLITTSIFADQPSFEAPFLIEVNGEPIKTDSPYYACPSIVDLDADGLPDLVIGQFKNGAMIFLKNSGKAGLPEFKSKSWVMTNQEPASVPGVW